jgi:hypothetical protein
MKSRTWALAILASLWSAGCIVFVGNSADFEPDEPEIAPTVQGSLRKSAGDPGAGATATRDLPAFERIAIRSSVDVVVRVGAERSQAVLTGDDGLLQHVETVVEDGVLRVSWDGGSHRPRHRMKISIGAPRLVGIDVFGSADVDVRGIAGDSIEIALTGSGDLAASGRVGRLVASIRGSGNLDLSELAAERATLTVDGSGDMLVDVSEEIAGVIRGTGDVLFTGSPVVSLELEGTGDVGRY